MCGKIKGQRAVTDQKHPHLTQPPTHSLKTPTMKEQINRGYMT